MSRDQQRLTAIRRSLDDTPHGDLVDALATGRIGRREFLRRGTVLGMSLSSLSVLAAACGSSSDSGSKGSPASGAPAKRGGTLRVAVAKPTGEIDPLLAGNQGAIAMILPSGEYLARSQPDLSLRPQLAESWRLNRDGSVWTFKLRSGVTFQDGSPMTARDVAATFNRLADPKNGSNALSALGGVLNKDSATAVDDTTVRFELEAPNGNFPYIVSSDNYNAVILPASYSGDYEKTFPGTGRMRMKSYDATAGATFVRNDRYWDKSSPALLDEIRFTFFGGETSTILSLQSGEVDVVNQVSVQNARPILDNANFKIISTRSAATRALHLRTDKDPFMDKRVRQALALTIDREAIVKGLLKGRADVGNDSPFAPVFKSTDPSVPQRKPDIARAKQLLAEAGMPNGFAARLTILDQFEIPDYAVLVKNNAQAAGIRLDIRQEDAATYYGDATFGKSDWLDSVAGITDYGHRGVPNVYLNAQVSSKGVWNSAHFKDPAADKLVKQYVAALDLDGQRKAARALQELLLDETPLIYSYFFNFLAGSAKNVRGIVPNASGQLFLTEAAFT